MTTKLLRCSDFGLECPVEFRGETTNDVLAQAQKHGMEVHGQTKAQVESEETLKMAAAKTRDDGASEA